jgi:hypothetical protein
MKFLVLPTIISWRVYGTTGNSKLTVSNIEALFMRSNKLEKKIFYEIRTLFKKE